MAANFDYQQAKNKINNIEQLKARLSNVLNEADNLIKNNINNDNVWNSDASQAFMREWSKYAENSFPAYINSFETQIGHINSVIETYTTTEM